MQAILNKLFLLLLAMVVLMPFPAGRARARERNYQDLSLEDCLAIAKEHNPVLAASRERINELVADYQAARSQFFPKLTLLSYYTRQPADRFVSGGNPPPNLFTKELYGGITGKQILFSGLKNYHNTKAAQKGTEAQKQAVFTSQEEIDLMLRGRLAKARVQLLTFRIILIIVSMVIITLVIYTFTMEKIRSIAIMKLMGAPNWVIIRLVLEQSLLLTVSSFIIGWLIIHSTQDYFPRKLFLTPLDESITFSLALFAGLIASGLGIWQALKIQPALALGGH